MCCIHVSDNANPAYSMNPYNPTIFASKKLLSRSKFNAERAQDGLESQPFESQQVIEGRRVVARFKHIPSGP